jgi:putative membrane protein
MFIDYLTLAMINLVAGTVVLAYYLWKGMDDQDQRPYAAVFGVTGLLALVLGLHMSFNWPLPGSYNIGFGETTTLFGVVFLATALALSQGWSLLPVSIYAFFAGVDAVLVGARILSLGLTKEPIMSAIGFISAGLGGVFAAPFFLWFKNNKTFRMLAALVLLATAALWAVSFYGALWGHLESFSKWVPLTMLTGK